MRSKQSLDSELDVKSRMLTTAEVAFAQKGHDRTSLRELTTLAGVNLAAVNYHFGSKEGLVTAVFEHLSHRVNRARVKELDSYLKDRAKENAGPELQQIIAIFLKPYLGEEVEHQGALLARLILQHRLSPTDLSRRIIKQHFDPMAKKFISALKSACPGVDAAEMYWRYTFMVSAVVLTITDETKDSRISRLSGGIVDATNTEFLRLALLRFLAGGVAAPSV